ncbi:PREDICTED: uncharacterized protein LOC106818727 [Priapulus caudatus]|uniref:Uncharacterized protein LOC106818727 n=1 Tax=Priapulus caudatus TaxID=37621 RepID=A0ABM1F366_PRICU|nr:PREDICTED: uncharacterized protein LOC106818727 [Priapulus caudatus]
MRVAQSFDQLYNDFDACDTLWQFGLTNMSDTLANPGSPGDLELLSVRDDGGAPNGTIVFGIRSTGPPGGDTSDVSNLVSTSLTLVAPPPVTTDKPPVTTDKPPSDKDALYWVVVAAICLGIVAVIVAIAIGCYCYVCGRDDKAEEMMAEEGATDGVAVFANPTYDGHKVVPRTAAEKRVLPRSKVSESLDDATPEVLLAAMGVRYSADAGGGSEMLRDQTKDDASFY